MVVLCGAGTFLLRWLPFWRARRRDADGQGADKLRGWLAGVGPAAISALLVVSMISVVGSNSGTGGFITAAAALAIVALVRQACRGGVAVPTLSGALAYGLMSYLAA